MTAKPQILKLPAAFDGIEVVFKNYTGTAFRYTQYEAVWDPERRKWRCEIRLYEDEQRPRKYEPDQAG